MVSLISSTSQWGWVSETKTLGGSPHAPLCLTVQSVRTSSRGSASSGPNSGPLSSAKLLPLPLAALGSPRKSWGGPCTSVLQGGLAQPAAARLPRGWAPSLPVSPRPRPSAGALAQGVQPACSASQHPGQLAAHCRPPAPTCFQGAHLSSGL